MTNDSKSLDSSSCYRFIELVDIKDIEFCHTNNFVQWGNGLTLDQYLKREKGIFAVLAKYGMTLTYWALQQKQTDGSWKIVSACESLCRPALYKKKGSPVEETLNHSIGSVFTPTEHRGKGYAKIMMRFLVDKLNHWKCEDLTTEQQSHTLISLWSDVGTYYAQFGYKLTDTREILCKLDEQQVLQWPEGVEKITSSEDIAEIAAFDEALMKETMDHDSETDGIPRVAIAPRAGGFEHTNWRAKYQAPYMSKVPAKVPTVFGAKSGATRMLWTQDFGANTLYVLRVVGDASKYKSPSDMAADVAKLVQAGLVEASEWKLTNFCLWNQDLPAPITREMVVEQYKKVGGLVKLELYERGGSLPMYHCEEVRKDIQWTYDGKYAWF
jgi:hypothetical protein